MRDKSADGPLLTIITVVRNDPDGFSATCNSLASIANQDIEWIVVDGSDNHSDIMNILDDQGLNEVTVVRDAATGVYPAMNIGLTLASGTYVYFLNAGDRIMSPSNFHGILNLLRTRSPLWLVASVAFESEDGRFAAAPHLDYEHEKRNLFARGSFPPHQGTIAQTQCLRDLGGFDITYRITADYHLMLQLSSREEPVISEIVLAKFKSGGISSTHWFSALGEFHRARRQVCAPTGTASISEYLQTLRLALRQAAFHFLVAPVRNRWTGVRLDP